MWGGVNNVRVVNLITQEGGYGQGSKPGKASVKFVSESLKALVKMAKKEGFTSIALPRIATGVGGLDWDEVWPVIEQRMGDLEIPVYVYSRYQPGAQAPEPGL